jgi:c-di-GMP-binding flagellar brake protein YcgR
MAKGTLFFEKRKHTRHDKELSVSYKLMPKGFEPTTEHKSGKVKDISLGGLRVEGDIQGKTGDLIRIEVSDKNSSSFLAEIKWVKKEASGFQFGLQFIGVREEDQQTIEELLS